MPVTCPLLARHLPVTYHYGFAIKVQGEQHEKYIKFFHRDDPNNFIRQQERDQLKKNLLNNKINTTLRKIIIKFLGLK